MNGRYVRCGTCSVCGVALESRSGGPENARPRARHLRANHHHRKPWRVIPDIGIESEDRAWHDQVPGFVR